MTKEEALETLKDTRARLYCAADGNPTIYADALEMAIKALKQTRWISVSERLPENEGDYLVTFKLSFMNFIEVCTFNKAGWDKVGYDEVVAWMPLPEPYRGREAED